jgi:predicted dehydrogenase
MKSENRRSFIKKSMVVSTGVALGAPAYIKDYMQTQPSDIINVAVCGINGRGKSHYSTFTKIKETRVVALCDPIDYLFPDAIAAVEKLGGPKPKTVSDYRNLMTDKDIDVISIATPDYWHALQTIVACQAGKDVYVEKPGSHTIDESRKMVQAARKYNRIVQIGTQHRSNRVSQKAIEVLHSGLIGDIYMGRGIEFKRRQSIGRVADSSVPEGVNWDLFRGPAPMIPFNKNHFLYNWHWYWDTSTSELSANGIHPMDRVRLGMKIAEHPTKIHCTGGFFGWDSDQEVPNFQVATFEYPNGKIMELEIRSLPNIGGSGDIEWYGTKGWATLSGSNFQAYVTDDDTGHLIASPRPAGTGQGQGPAGGASGQRPAGMGMPSRSAPKPTVSITPADLPVDARADELSKAGIDPHFMNFVDCVKSRKREDLKSEIEVGHISTTQALLGCIAYRTGRKLTFDGKTERFVNDDDANTYLARPGGGRKPFNIPDVV